MRATVQRDVRPLNLLCMQVDYVSNNLDFVLIATSICECFSRESLSSDSQLHLPKLKQQWYYKILFDQLRSVCSTVAKRSLPGRGLTFRSRH